MAVKAGAEIIAALNEILTGELTAVNQYFLHARMLKNWGLNRLAERVYHESIDEMRHADWLIERILYLDSVPNTCSASRPHPHRRDRARMFASDLAVEQEAIPRLNATIAQCVAAGDGTRELLAGLVSEEEHLDWLETQVSLVDRLTLLPVTSPSI
ncbi:MAG: bacterioferritin [Myxococcota bacterium]